MKKNIFISVIGLLFVSMIMAQEHDFSFMEKYEMGDAPELKIKTNDGFIDVYPSNSKTIEVYYIVKQRGHLLDITRDELEREMEVSVNYDKNNLDVSVRNFSDRNWINWRDRLDVSFEVKVPKEIFCSLKTSDGNIYLKGLTGDQYCKTSDGKIEISFVKGNLKAVTSDGDIVVNDVIGNTDLATSDGDIRVRKVLGDLDIVTSDGSIDIWDVKGETYAHTSDGNISFEELKGSFKAETSDGHIEGSMTELFRLLDLRTSDGDIDVVIPEDLGLDVEAKGERIYMDLVNYHRTYKNKSIRETIDGGGIEVSLRTTDGKISLSSN